MIDNARKQEQHTIRSDGFVSCHSQPRTGSLRGRSRPIQPNKTPPFWVVTVGPRPGHKHFKKSLGAVLQNGNAVEALGWLALLATDDADLGWANFLHAFAQIILQVIAVCESDAENRAECFVYVCEQLAQHRFRRLRRFQRDGPATFNTWLRAVVRNLCLDWRRREFGRNTTFVATHPASPLDREVSDRLFRCGMRDNEVVEDLCTPSNDVSHAEVESSLDRVYAQMVPRQAWARSARSIVTESIEGENGTAMQVADPAPTPETVAELRESKRALRRGLRSLPFEQQLAIALRFEQDLTLQEIATLLHLKNAQAVDRMLRDAFARLREAVDSFPPLRGKTKPASV